MYKTSVRSTFELIDPQIQNDAEPSTISNSIFANISKLNEVRKGYDAFLTLEHNINILDGSLEYFELSNSDLSYFSKTLSQNNLETKNEISINFSKFHSSYGIIMNFGGNNFLGDVEITYFNNNEVISTYNATPNHSEDSFPYGATNFNKIKFKFKNTKFPRMFSRLQYLIYGHVINWGSGDIVSCNISEKVHPISKEVPVNTCELSVYSIENDLNILDESSYFQYLMKNQKFRIFATVDDIEYNFGTFYLDTWDTTDPNISKFNLISPLGILNNETFYDVWFYLNPTSEHQGETTYSALNKVLNIYNMKTKLDFDISNELTTPLFGILPFTNYKSILQIISFCSCAIVDDTRDGAIKIKNILDTGSSKLISLNQMFNKVVIRQNELPNKIELNYYRVVLQNQEDAKYNELFYGEMSSGEIIRLESTQALEYIRYKKTDEENWNYYEHDNLYYVNFVAPSSGNYTIEGSTFDINKESFMIFEISNKNQLDNTIKIENEPLIFKNIYGYGNDAEFIENIKKYYNSVPFMAEFEFINDGTVKTGDVVTIETECNKNLKGYIIEQSIDLSGGLISKAKLIGDVVDES